VGKCPETGLSKSLNLSSFINFILIFPVAIYDENDMMDDIEAEYDLPSAKPGRKLYPAFSEDDRSSTVSADVIAMLTQSNAPSNSCNYKNSQSY
jgi:hypothetical protein